MKEIGISGASPNQAMQLTPKSVTQIAFAICAPLSGAADHRRWLNRMMTIHPTFKGVMTSYAIQAFVVTAIMALGTLLPNFIRHDIVFITLFATPLIFAFYALHHVKSWLCRIPIGFALPVGSYCIFIAFGVFGAFLSLLLGTFSMDGIQ